MKWARQGESLRKISRRQGCPKYDLLVRWLEDGSKPPEADEPPQRKHLRGFYSDYIAALRTQSLTDYDSLRDIESKMLSGEISAAAGSSAIRSIQWRMERLQKSLFALNVQDAAKQPTEVVHVHKIGAQVVKKNASPLELNEHQGPEPTIHPGSA